MDRIGRRLAAMHEFNRDSSVVLVPLREVLTGTVETSLLVLYLAVGVLLAIACFNIANLLIARAAIAAAGNRGAHVARCRSRCYRPPASRREPDACARRRRAGHRARAVDASTRSLAFAPASLLVRAGAADRHARADVRGRVVAAHRARRRACALVHHRPAFGRELAEREQFARDALAPRPSGARRWRRWR